MKVTNGPRYDIRSIAARAHSLGLRLERQVGTGAQVWRLWEFATGAPVGMPCTAKVLPRILDEWERHGRASKQWTWMLNRAAYRLHGWRPRTSPSIVRRERDAADPDRIERAFDRIALRIAQAA